jgi:hypothetical protein
VVIIVSNYSAGVTMYMVDPSTYFGPRNPTAMVI